MHCRSGPGRPLHATLTQSRLLPLGGRQRRAESVQAFAGFGLCEAPTASIEGNGMIEIGRIYMDAKPPRRTWRVCREDKGTYTLERIDKPSTMRFVDEAALSDHNRYVPEPFPPVKGR